MLLCWVRWEGQRAAGLCLSSIMELSTCSCLYLNMDEHRTNLNGVWWPTCKNPVLVLTHQEHLSHDGSWPQEPAPSAVTWQRRYMTAQNIFPIFGWQRLSTIHSLLAKQLALLMGTHSCTWDTCKHASGVRSQCCPTGMGRGMGTWIGAGMGTAPTCCNSCLQPV